MCEKSRRDNHLGFQRDKERSETEKETWGEHGAGDTEAAWDMSDDSTTKQDLLIIGVAIASAILLVSASNFLQPVMPTDEAIKMVPTTIPIVHTTTEPAKITAAENVTTEIPKVIVAAATTATPVKATPVVTPTYWNDTRRESVGIPADGIGSCCVKDCIPACEFPWWCGE